MGLRSWHRVYWKTNQAVGNSIVALTLRSYGMAPAQYDPYLRPRRLCLSGFQTCLPGTWNLAAADADRVTLLAYAIDSRKREHICRLLWSTGRPTDHGCIRLVASCEDSTNRCRLYQRCITSNWTIGTYRSMYVCAICRWGYTANLASLTRQTPS